MMTERTSREKQNQKMTWLLFGALAAWAVFLSVGGYLGVDDDLIQRETLARNKETKQVSSSTVKPEELMELKYDWRKPLIVIGFTSIFLGFWALMLRSRSNRLACFAEKNLLELEQKTKANSLTKGSAGEEAL